MPRFTTRQGPIEIAYGFEMIDNTVFLRVVDSRLAWNSEASPSINEVATTVGLGGDGCGAYVSLRTSKMGIGKLVDDSTMATYLARYGVSNEQIFGLPLKLPDSHPQSKNFSIPSLEGIPSSTDARQGGQCSECKANSTRVCGKCHVMPYCSRDCQKKNWAIHKVFCGMKTLPSDLDPEHSVQVILLPSDCSNPSFLRVPKKSYFDEWGREEAINTNMFFMTPRSIHSQCFRAAKQAALESKKSYEIVYKDDFLIDRRSTANLCIGNLLLDKRDTMHWRGNVLLAKTGLGRLPKYEDITMSDVKNAVEFLQDYTATI